MDRGRERERERERERDGHTEDAVSLVAASIFLIRILILTLRPRY